MEVNEKFIKIGKLPVSTEIPLGSHIQIQIPGDGFYQLQCVKVEHKDLQDGTEDIIYSLKHDPS